LSGVTARFSVADLFAAVAFPSRDVAPAYYTQTFELRDSQSFTGVVAFESADGVILQTGAETTVRLDAAEIVSRRESHVSLMPSGLLEGLQPGELADLYSLLRSLRPGGSH
jgi:putative heme-binding domain-containing protein